MTTYMVKNASLVAGAAVALLAGNASALVADAQTGDSWSSTSTATEASETTAGSGVVERDKVEGSFSFTQGEVTPTGVIARNLSGSSTVLCGNEGVATGEAASYEDWVVEVVGEVSNPFTATLAEMSDVQGTASLVMGCSCLGNPVDGRASANADVLGISLASIVERAGVAEGVNTVVFTSADGYEVALPLFNMSRTLSRGNNRPGLTLRARPGLFIYRHPVCRPLSRVSVRRSSCCLISARGAVALCIS